MNNALRFMTRLLMFTAAMCLVLATYSVFVSQWVHALGYALGFITIYIVGLMFGVYLFLNVALNDARARLSSRPPEADGSASQTT